MNKGVAFGLGERNFGRHIALLAPSGQRDNLPVLRFPWESHIIALFHLPLKVYVNWDNRPAFFSDSPADVHIFKVDMPCAAIRAQQSVFVKLQHGTP